MSKGNFLILFLIMGLAFILNFFGIRVCPFFNIFKIPCPGCGLTRAFKLLFMGKFVDSLKLNILAVIIVSVFIIYCGFIIFRHKKTVDNFLKKHQTIITILAAILTIIVWILNLYNPLLY